MSNQPIDRKRRSLLRALGALPLVPGLLHAGSSSPGSSGIVRKQIPSSGEKIPVIGIGTSRVFEVSESRAERQGPLEALSALQQLGNAMIDTSPMYGEAEQVIGELMPLLPKPAGFFLATKVWTHGRQSGIEQMNNSLRLLGSDRIDLMQIHNLVDWRTHIETLREWKSQGRIRYIGITHYREDAHAELMDVMANIPDLDFVQVNYSLLEPAAEQRLLPMAGEHGVAVIANRPFGRGNWFNLTRGKTLPDWVKEMGISSWAQFALKWIVSHPAIICTIPGTGNARHMLDNIQVALTPLAMEHNRTRMTGLVKDL